MGSLISILEGPSDAELISAVRGGDVDAYGELFARHVEAARRLARQLVSAADADDLVSEAFAKVLVVLQRGGGPDLAFRAYLLTAVRRLHVDRVRSTAKLQTTGDLTPFDPGVPFRDTAVEGFESTTAARAFASLPERWQLVLWHTEVEGQKPAEVAPILAMSPNSVSALAYRAREGLREAYLSLHAQDVDDDGCARTRAALGAYVRGGLSRRDSARVEQHLEECRRCAAIHLELTEVNSHLGAVMAPLLLGSAAASYVGAASGGVTAASGTVTALLGRARDAVVAHAPTAAVAGVAASAVLGGLLLTLHRTDSDLPTAERAPAVIGARSPADRTPAETRGRRDGSTRTPDVRGAPPTRRLPEPTTGPTSDPSSQSPTPASTPPSSPPSSPPATPPSTAPSAAPSTPQSTPQSSPPATPQPPPATPPQSPAVQLAATVSAGPVEVGAGVRVERAPESQTSRRPVACNALSGPLPPCPTGAPVVRTERYSGRASTASIPRP